MTIANMNLNGRNSEELPSPDLASLASSFIGDDIATEHTEVCFVLGSQFYGRAVNTLIQGNRIHDCGKEPATNLEHGIYVAVADNTRIVNNVIYKNADRGIQIDPDAQGTVLFGGAHGTVNRPYGFGVGSNKSANPQYAAPATGDRRPATTASLAATPARPTSPPARL